MPPVGVLNRNRWHIVRENAPETPVWHRPLAAKAVHSALANPSKEPLLHVQNVGTLEENAACLVTKSPALRLDRLLLQRCCGLIQFSAGSVEQDAGTVPVFWRPLHLMVYGCPFVGRHGGHLGKTPLVLHDADSHRWICGVSQQYGTPGGATLHALRGLVVCPSRYLVEEVIKRRIAVRQQLYRVRVPIEDRGPEGDGPRRLAVVKPVRLRNCRMRPEPASRQFGSQERLFNLAEGDRTFRPA